MSVWVPQPFAIAIDDLGWLKGHNDGYQLKGPYRLGLKRQMTIEDYRAVIDLAQRVNIRLQGLFVLGEFDREGATSQFDTLVSQDFDWKILKSQLQVDIIDLVKSNVAHLEFGLHGVGHEYWPLGATRFKRAEWYNLEDKEPWPEQSIRDHIQCFKDIMAQYDLTPGQGHSFPRSFVPCAYSYYWNPTPADGEYSLGAILGENGVKYANTDFSKIPERRPPIDDGMDQGVHVINRYNYGNLWYEVGKTPTIPIEYHNTQYVEVHWPNLLAQDDFLQEEVTSMWVRYFDMINRLPDRYCAKSTDEMHSQYLYAKYCTVRTSGSKIFIDSSSMPDDPDYRNKLQGLVLKFKINEGSAPHSYRIKGDQSVLAVYQDDAYIYLYLPKIDQSITELEPITDTYQTQDIILHDTTNSYYEMCIDDTTIRIKGLFFGRQLVSLQTKKEIVKAVSDSPSVIVHNIHPYQDGYKLDLESMDIQGSKANIHLNYTNG